MSGQFGANAVSTESGYGCTRDASLKKHYQAHEKETLAKLEVLDRGLAVTSQRDEQRLDLSQALVGYRDGEVVLRELPLMPFVQHHAAPSGRPQVSRR